MINPKPVICSVVAMDQSRVIGNNNELPWDIPEDSQYLRELTKGYPLLMGRATHESICAMRGIDPYTNRAMPGRYNVVISTKDGYFREDKPELYSLAPSPEVGLRHILNYAAANNLDKIFIFGGQTIYEQLMPQTERLYLTEIQGSHKGDAYFPDFDRNEWTRVSHDPHDNGRHKYAFNVYERVKNP